MGATASKDDQENSDESNPDQDEEKNSNDSEPDNSKDTNKTEPDQDSSDQKEADDNSPSADSVKTTSLSKGAIAGIVVALIIVVVVVVVVAVLLTQPSGSASSGTISSGSNSSAVVSSSGSNPISSGSSSVSSSGSTPSNTNTIQLLSVNVVGVPSPPFPGATTISGPFTSVIPTTSDATVFFAMNDDPDTFNVRLSGTNYPGGNTLIISSIGTSGVSILTVAVLGYSLKTGSSALLPDPVVPFCNTYVLTLFSVNSTNTTLGIPFSLPGLVSDYVSFVQNADVSANPAIVTGSTIFGTNTVQFGYNIALVGLCRFNLIVARVNTTGISTGSVLYAETVTLVVSVGTSLVNYTLQSNVTNPSGSIQWFAQGGTSSRFEEVHGIKQIAPNQVRLGVTSISTSIVVSIIAFKSTPPFASPGFVF